MESNKGVIEGEMTRFDMQDKNAGGQMAVEHRNILQGDRGDDEGAHRSTTVCVNKVS